MNEAVEISKTPLRFSWTRALTAGLVATVIMTVVLMLTGMNIMKMLGSMIAPASGMAVQYVIGGAIHLMIGLFYGVVYAWLVGRVMEWNRFVKGTVYGLAIAAIAFAVMPVMSAMTGGNGAGPCGGANPCGVAAASSAAANPCAGKNPCAAKNPCATKNPCAPQNPCTATNPCAAKNPCASKNPCAAKTGTAGNACGGATNPCGGSQGPYSGAISVLNHLVYALTLAFVYGRGGTR